MRRGAAALVALAALALAGAAGAQARLVTGGSRTSFGRHALAAGAADPWTLPVTSGGNLDARSLGVGDACRGFVMAWPDVVLDVAEPGDLLRVFFLGSGDTTLIVHAPGDRWRCNDDSYGGLHPTVDVSAPVAGRYEIWVGSYRAGEAISGRLHVTRSRERHP